MQPRLPLLSHLPRARASRIDLLVSAGRAGAARARRATASSVTCKEASHERARADAAGVLHRPADPRSATPARTRSRPTATRSGCCSPSPHQQTGKQPCQLDIDELDAPLIGAFLDHLEHDRGNSIRTRNARLAAIHSLFRYAALRHPEHAETISRVLAIPPKRSERALITFLTDTEIDALLAAPDRDTWTGRRDHALLLLAIQTGLRGIRADRPERAATSTSAPARTSAAAGRDASSGSRR